MPGPVTHKRHPTDGPIVHDGPGHRFGDPSYCGGCWWELEGQYRPPMGTWDRHADDCPGCRVEGATCPA
jgi:hypothetical protein